jgi:hypothetical protein
MTNEIINKLLLMEEYSKYVNYVDGTINLIDSTKININTSSFFNILQELRNEFLEEFRK